MNVMTQFKNISQVQKFLRSIPDIDFGGCGIAALVIYDYLVVNKVDAEIVYAYHSYDPDYETNLSAIQNGGDRLQACAHAMVKVNGLFHDCRGERRVDTYARHHAISREMVVKSLDSSGWNDTFKRYRYLPVIEKAIGYDIKLGYLQN